MNNNLVYSITYNFKKKLLFVIFKKTLKDFEDTLVLYVLPVR